jgi:hypothetical protein
MPGRSPIRCIFATQSRSRLAAGTDTGDIETAGDTNTDGEKPGNPLGWLVWGDAACLLLVMMVTRERKLA